MRSISVNLEIMATEPPVGCTMKHSFMLMSFWVGCAVLLLRAPWWGSLTGLVGRAHWSGVSRARRWLCFDGVSHTQRCQVGLVLFSHVPPSRRSAQACSCTSARGRVAKAGPKASPGSRAGEMDSTS